MSMIFTMWRLNAVEMKDVCADQKKGEKLAATWIAPRMSPEVWARIEARLPTMDPTQRELTVQQHANSEDPRIFALANTWHLVHYLVCGDNSMAPGISGGAPLQLLVYGGSETSYTVNDYGPALTLDADQVSACSVALTQLRDETIRGRAAPELLNRMKIYPTPTPGGWNEQTLSIIWPVLSRLREFYLEAASNGDSIFKAMA